MKRLLPVIMLILLFRCGRPLEEAAVVQATAIPPTATQAVATALPPTATVPPTATTSPTATPTILVALELPPTESVTPPTAEPVVSVVAAEEAVAMFGRTAEGALFIGRADAEITVIDYSDFL